MSRGDDGRAHGGRFAPGNPFAAAGGRARAAALSARRRREIAALGRAALVEKRFAGDERAQRIYFAALGLWNSEKVFIGSAIPVRAVDPGRPTDFLARYWQLHLFAGDHRDVDFYA